MSEYVVKIGRRLNETHALQVAADLALIDLSGPVRLDFSQTEHFEPFAMLLVGSAVRRLQELGQRVGTTVAIDRRGVDPEGIAAHSGFWQSIGLDIGRAVNAAPGRDGYLPVQRIGVSDLYRSSGGSDPLAAGVIEGRAAELADVLCRPAGGRAMSEAMTYSLRELIRNVVEHAMKPALWVCGMSWPKRDFVQVALLDEGRGVRQSLADHSSFAFDTDLKALEEALRPNVSRNIDRQRTPEYLERWHEERHDRPREFFENSGYGLHLVSTLCREAGQFHIASGSAYLGFIGSAQLPGSTAHHGTALRLVLEPSKVEGALDRLFEGIAARTPADRRPLLSASKLRRLGLDSLLSGSGED